MSHNIRNTSLINLSLRSDEIGRFLKKIKATADSDGCWEWDAARDNKGYGKWLVWRNSASTKLKAHRLAFFLHWGIDPEDYLICHECDNPPCCNPRHLFAGTYGDNVRDAFRKGRASAPVGHAVRGEQVKLAKLTRESVLDIRRIYGQPGITQASLAEVYKVSRCAIASVLTGRTWKHV